MAKSDFFKPLLDARHVFSYRNPTLLPYTHGRDEVPPVADILPGQPYRLVLPDIVGRIHRASRHLTFLVQRHST